MIEYVIYLNVLQQIQTGDMTRNFLELVKRLNENPHWLGSSHYTDFVHKCITVNTNLPKDKLKKMLELNIIPNR